MNRREMILAAGVGALAAAYGAHWAYNAVYERPLEARRAETDRLLENTANRQLDLARIAKAGKDMKRWESQALPADTEVARSLYRAWLVELVGTAGLTNPNVDSSEPIVRSGLYHSLSFSIRGRGTLKQLTQFLYDFYRSDHLHQIQSLNLTPVPRLEELEIAMSIEALSLADSKNTNRLSPRTSERLASNELSEYQSIVERNLFGIGGGGADQADLAYLTAITEVDGQPEAWFTLRGSGKLLKLRPREPFEIGPFHGIVAEIHHSDVVFECEDERWLLTIGENLAQASTLPPEL